MNDSVTEVLTKEEPRPEGPHPLLGDKTYNKVKHLVQYVLPALGTFYFTIAQIWGLMYGEQVVGTLAALATLLGVVLAVSKRSYDKSGLGVDGVIQVNHFDQERPLTGLQVDRTSQEIQSKKQLTFKVEDVSG